MSWLRHDRIKETGIWGIKLLLAHLHIQRDWLPGECLVLPILFTQWLFLFGTAVNFPMGFVWQQVTVKKCCLPLLCIVIFFFLCWIRLDLLHLILLHLPHVLCFHFSMSVVSTSLHAQIRSPSPPPKKSSDATRGNLSAAISVPCPLCSGHLESNSWSMCVFIPDWHDLPATTNRRCQSRRREEEFRNGFTISARFTVLLQRL